MFNKLIENIRGIADVMVKNDKGELLEIGANLSSVVATIPNKDNEEIDTIFLYDHDDRGMALATIERHSIELEAIGELLNIL